VHTVNIAITDDLKCRGVPHSFCMTAELVVLHLQLMKFVCCLVDKDILLVS